MNKKFEIYYDEKKLKKILLQRIKNEKKIFFHLWC